MTANKATTSIELPTGGNGSSLGFYTSAEASRIARVPQWTLNSWRREGVVIPSAEWVDEQDKTHRGHTFETLVFLRLIRMLREKRITLLESVKAVKSLRDRFGPPGKRWAEAKIFAEHGVVYVYDRDEWQTTVATRGHQKVADSLFGDEFARLRDRADALLIPNQFMYHVEIDPAIRNGLPIVLYTSVLTSVIHSFRQQGHKYDEIHDMYPFISKRTISGADKYEGFLDGVSAVG